MISDVLVSLPPFRKLNSAYYYYRRNTWRWKSAFRTGAKCLIDRPVYLIGTQNGGLTLLARILHRHAQVVSATGDHRSWAGDDELQNVLEPILPEDFGWRRIDIEGFCASGHSWLYGTDEFLPYYRRRASDANPALGARYRKLLEGVIRLHSGGRSVRFVDKSQSLTLRVGLVHASLRDCDPRFVLVSRNPYSVVWSQAQRNADLAELGLDIETRVKLCAQHWRNTFEAALEDAETSADVKLSHWRFEALLAEPERVTREICEFADLAWDSAILPGARDKIPFGSMHDAWTRRKWYPLRPNANKRWLDELPAWALSQIQETCGPLADRLGYAPPASSEE